MGTLPVGLGFAVLGFSKVSRRVPTGLFEDSIRVSNV